MLARTRTIYRSNGEKLVYVDGHLVSGNLFEDDSPRSVTNYISDIIDPTKHMADGKTYTSKSEFRKATKRAGCIEIGNEVDFVLKERKSVKLSREKRRHNIREAISMLKSRM